MTPDERIEKLLNRAGQTISDLPKATNYDFAYTDFALAIESVHEFECCEDITTLEFADYILHLTDIIDRMETALENVCGERDYLLKTQSFDCEDCVNYGPDDCPEMRTDPDLWCDSTTAIWKGVSEYWRVDDSD